MAWTSLAWTFDSLCLGLRLQESSYGDQHWKRKAAQEHACTVFEQMPLLQPPPSGKHH